MQVAELLQDDRGILMIMHPHVLSLVEYEERME